jgi:hypothetical protein
MLNLVLVCPVDVSCEGGWLDRGNLTTPDFDPVSVFLEFCTERVNSKMGRGTEFSEQN